MLCFILAYLFGVLIGKAIYDSLPNEHPVEKKKYCHKIAFNKRSLRKKKTNVKS